MFARLRLLSFCGLFVGCKHPIFFVEFAAGLMAAALPSFGGDSALLLPSVRFYWCHVLSEQLKRFVVQILYNPSIQRASQKLQETGFESFYSQRTNFTFPIL